MIFTEFVCPVGKMPWNSHILVVLVSRDLCWPWIPTDLPKSTCASPGCQERLVIFFTTNAT